jgi:MoaA/NifB/PqqE/SkfB family radical SAM enzyme
MCNIWQLKTKQKDLDFSTAVKIIDRLYDWLGAFNLTFAGGEPFLNKNFFKIIAYANQKGINTRTNSNGYVINQTMANKLATSGLSRIFFSIDGLQKEHNFVRGKKDSFQRVTAAINYLSKTKNNDKKPKIFINSVISNNNIAIIGDLIKLAQTLKVSGINFQVLMPNFASQYNEHWFENDPLWPKKLKQIIITTNKLLKLKNQYPDFILNSNRDIKNFTRYLAAPKDYQEKEQCLVGFNNCMVDTSGNIRLCYEMGTVGNMLKEKPENLWLSDKAKKHRVKIVICQRPCKLLPCNDVRILSLLKNFFYQ